MLAFIGIVIGYYIFASICIYGFAVLRNWELTDIWNFEIKGWHVGVCPTHKFFVFWIAWLIRKFSR